MTTATKQTDQTRLQQMLDKAGVVGTNDGPAVLGAVKAKLTDHIKPGIYTDISRATYDLIPAINSTLLKIAAGQTLAHAHAYLTDQDDGGSNDAFAFGDGFHTATLEPQLFPKKFVLWPDENGRRAGKKWEDFVKAHMSMRILREKDYDLILSLSETMHAHPAVQQLWKRQPYSNEVTLIWLDSHANCLCKARADRVISDEAPTVVDVKTAAAADPHKFSRSIWDFGYDVQAAWYTRGLRILTPGAEAPNFVLPVIEKSGKAEAVVYRIGTNTLRMGWIRMMQALRDVLKAIKTDEWPGWSDEVLDIDAPDWALKRHGLRAEVQQ